MQVVTLGSQHDNHESICRDQRSPQPTKSCLHWASLKATHISLDFASVLFFHCRGHVLISTDRRLQDSKQDLDIKSSRIQNTRRDASSPDCATLYCLILSLDKIQHQLVGDLSMSIPVFIRRRVLRIHTQYH